MPNAEQCPDHQKRREIGRKCRCETEHGIQPDIQHQNGTASEAICQTSENEGSERPAGERQGDRERHMAFLDAEFLGYVFEYENQEKKVEGIQRPAQVTGNHRILLRRRPALQRVQ